MTGELGQFSLDRMVRAVERVRERLLRATDALNRAGVAYAVVVGNAVAAWVSRVDESAARNTQNVDILIRRDDLEAVERALKAVGLEVLDGFGPRAIDGVRVVFAAEGGNPDVNESEMAGGFRVLNLPALLRTKLTAFRDADRTHIRDLIDVGVIDATWPDRYPPALAERLRGILETPGG